MDEVTVSVTLPPSQAMAFAQFLKRSTFSTYKDCAVDSDEAYQMIYAGNSIRSALAEAGYAPR